VYDAVTNLAKTVVGTEFTDAAEIAAVLEQEIAACPREARWAAAGIELAAWDLVGKSRGVPVAALLRDGDRPIRSAVPVYGSLPRYERVSDLVSAAVECVEQGYRTIKIHQIDVASVAAVREAIGREIQLILDANCAWNTADAVAMARRLHHYDLRWLEEAVGPPDDYLGLGQVRKQAGVMIACGENGLTERDFKNAIEAGSADIYQPSLLKVGGLTAMRRIVRRIVASRCQLVPHSYYPGPGFAASLHFAATCDAVALLEIAHVRLRVDITTTNFECQDGYVHVPTKPGLGADPNPIAIDHYAVDGEDLDG
jgi:L-alanine-DL-glutamate epimerase-like enolase superfamily enzyme